MRHNSTQPNTSVGLNSDHIDEARFQEQVYKFVARDDTRGGGQAPVPRGTVGKANALRRSILELSLAPDIYMNKRLQIKDPSRLG